MSAEGQQGEALLGLAGAWAEVSAEAGTEMTNRLHANPVICTQAVLDAAREAGEEHELATLDQMLEAGLLVISDRPSDARARLAGERPGYLNRKARRALRRGRK